MRISDWSSDVVLFRSWLDNAPADRKPIPTPALPLKGRGNSLGWKKNGGPPRPLVDLRGGVKAIQRCGEGQRHHAIVPAHAHFALSPSKSEVPTVGKGVVSTCRSRWSPSY